MKIFIIILIVLLTISLFAKSDKAPKAEDKSEKYCDTDSLKFTPLIPDSLDTTRAQMFLHPERFKNFQQENGVVIVPNPRDIETNPDGVQYADPSVDLGIIYPLETRQKIILQKKMKNRQEHKRLKELYEKRLKEKEQNESEKEDE